MNIGEMFDKRSVVGVRVEEYLKKHNIKKVDLCKYAGISRPTLDRLLCGEITSKTNYEKHLSKILDYLKLTPDMLFGNVSNGHSRIRIVRNIVKMTIENVAERTKITPERLQEIEGGCKATVAEMRDIALCFSTSTKVLSGENVFEPQIADMDDFIRYSNIDNKDDFSGFWGHIGLFLVGTDKYIWFPITYNTCKLIRRNSEDERIVVPCMDNKLLLLNKKYIKEIILLDDACGQPEDVYWDYNVGEGEIPLVVYEALEDYICLGEEAMDDNILSVQFYNYLNYLWQENEWSEEKVFELVDGLKIYYTDGTVRNAKVGVDHVEAISSEVFEAYSCGEPGGLEDFLMFEDVDGADIYINMQNISMLELPLLKIETAIYEAIKELAGE